MEQTQWYWLSDLILEPIMFMLIIFAAHGIDWKKMTLARIDYPLNTIAFNLQ